MTTDGALALIVVKPGPLRDGLQALLIAMPQVDAVEQMCDVSSALEAALERPPALVLLDSGLAGSGIRPTLRQAKARWPQARSIFLADSVQQQCEAETVGADAVLLKGTPPERLVATIVRLLSQHGNSGESRDGAVSSTVANVESDARAGGSTSEPSGSGRPPGHLTR
jgi:DNA-binding NarL/FixJ family response regulator